MDILLVRHGESTSNVAGRLQGHADAPLTDLGRAQAARAGAWLKARGLRWTAAYASPLSRARDTAAIIAGATGYPAAVPDDDLKEVSVGQLEGLTREEIWQRHPSFRERSIADLGDFSAYGGEGYDEVQVRVSRLLTRFAERHRAGADIVLVVAHGGINFQLVKAALCVPVPRVCLLHWGNCTVSLLKFRERRGAYMAEVSFHMPVELMGGESHESTTGVFR
jgi:probable phosphoglycerate mutase